MKEHLNKQELCGLVHAKLEQLLAIPSNDSMNSNPDNAVILEAMRYSCLNGGKRIRPLLTIAAGYASNAELETLVTLGAIIELVHCYSLIHDDLPAMDNDDLRRGVATCHKKYGEAIAILAGDALQALAFQLLSAQELALTPATKLRIIHLLASCIGHNGMVGGQAIDMLNTGKIVNVDALQNMDKMKTGALIKAAVLSGYLAGDNVDANAYASLGDFAEHLGLLFQLIDDILDVTADTETLGKTANKDAIANKATYVSILGMDHARALVEILYNHAAAKLQMIANHQPLMELLNYVYKSQRPA